MHPFLNTIFPAVRKASQLILAGLGDVKTLSVQEKGLYNYVTQIDQQSEKILVETVKKAYPTHSIQAEEGGAVEGDDYLWLIDPLDGTKNFVNGFPHLCISIAVLYQQRLEHALIYDPIRDELFTASRGKGAKLNNNRIRVNPNQTLQGSLIATAIPTLDKSFFSDYMKGFTKIYPYSSGLRCCGSAALNLAYVAAGRVGGHWEMGLAPWDIAAGALLVREAGGLVSDSRGGDDFLTTGNIVAGAPKVFKGLIQNLHHLD